MIYLYSFDNIALPRQVVQRTIYNIIFSFFIVCTKYPNVIYYCILIIKTQWPPNNDYIRPIHLLYGYKLVV